MTRTWSTEQIQLLRVEYPTATPKELAVLFPDKTPTAIKTKAQVLGLKKARSRFYFSASQLDELRKIYANTSITDIAIKFGCPVISIYNAAHRLGLKKDIEFIRQTSAAAMRNPNHGGRMFLIKKGNIPMNKGKRQADYMTPEAIERTKAARFKKGQKGHNYKPVGYERINVDGYIEVKVKEPNVFKLKHRLVWIKHHGEVEKGHNIQFKDGNRLNCGIENLYLISRADQMKNNSGAVHLPDAMVASYMAGSPSRRNYALAEELKQHAELLELKRRQLLLNREIKKKNGNSKSNADSARNGRQHLRIRRKESIGV